MKIYRHRKIRVCASDDNRKLVIGKFVVLLSNDKISGLDEAYWDDSIPGYFVCSLATYDARTNSVEGTVVVHNTLMNYLNADYSGVVCGSVDINASGIRDITFSDESKVTEGVMNKISEIYGF